MWCRMARLHVPSKGVVLHIDDTYYGVNLRRRGNPDSDAVCERQTGSASPANQRVGDYAPSVVPNNPAPCLMSVEYAAL